MNYIWRIKIWRICRARMTSYLPQAAWPRIALWLVYVRSCVVRLRWSPSLRWRAVYEVPRVRLQNLWERNCRVSGKQCSSSDAKAHHRRLPSGRCQLLARYFWPISCLLVISRRSVVCSLFLADQCYFCQIRDRGTVSACASLTSSVAMRPRPHARRDKINIGGI